MGQFCTLFVLSTYSNSKALLLMHPPDRVAPNVCVGMQIQRGHCIVGTTQGRNGGRAMRVSLQMTSAVRSRRATRIDHSHLQGIVGLQLAYVASAGVLSSQPLLQRQAQVGALSRG